MEKERQIPPRFTMPQEDFPSEDLKLEREERLFGIKKESLRHQLKSSERKRRAEGFKPEEVFPQSVFPQVFPKKEVALERQTRFFGGSNFKAAEIFFGRNKGRSA